jgi:hypothetical protein
MEETRREQVSGGGQREEARAPALSYNLRPKGLAAFSPVRLAVA